MAKKMERIEVLEVTPARQCNQFALELTETIEKVEVVAIACGVGVQTLVRHFLIPNLPGVNTTFLGETVAHGHWEERCQAWWKLHP
jgi:hypothetical protein